MKRPQHARIFGLIMSTAGLVALIALFALIAGPPPGTYAAQAIGQHAAAPAHESQTPEGTETQQPEGTETHQPEGTETQQPEGTETHQPEGTETAHPEGTETQQPEGTETAHPEGTETQQPEGTETAQPEGTETHQPEGTETPEATETHHPAMTETPEGTETAQPEATETHHPDMTETPEGTETAQPEGTQTPEPEPTHVLTLEPRVHFGEVQGGQTYDFSFTLHNHGTVADAVALGVSSQLGWDVVVSPTNVLLDPDGSAMVDVTVNVPAGASGLDTETLAATDGTNSATAYVVLSTEQRPFSDLRPTDWAWNPVQYLAGRNVISGYADGSFRPGNTVTRAQFAKMIVTGMGWALLQPQRPSFSDVPATDWAFAYVETAAAHGILSGYADGSFRPMTNVTRAQLAKLIVVARGWQLRLPAQATFGDVPATDWSFPYVETAVDAGVLAGYADGTFHPTAPATRAQVAKILSNGLILAQR